MKQNLHIYIPLSSSSHSCALSHNVTFCNVQNMYGFVPPAPPCAHDSMMDTGDDYSALFISRQNYLLCSSLALHVLNQEWSWPWLPFPSSFSSSSLSSLFSRYTFSINNLHFLLYFAVSLSLLLSYSHFLFPILSTWPVGSFWLTQKFLYTYVWLATYHTY